MATCKAQIRKSPVLTQGDWIVGLGSVAMGNEGRVIYAACVEEIISFDQYWNDERFQVKKPITKGTLLQMYGDNVYHTVNYNHKNNSKKISNMLNIEYIFSIRGHELRMNDDNYF